MVLQFFNPAPFAVTEEKGDTPHTREGNDGVDYPAYGGG